ncbi:MAG: hypothetical protein IBX55_10755 [Methyloprofundus sp.]|nr:hypothetical protein [Methyloprofundus sp.]
MLVKLVDKQRRAVSVVKTALLAQGITGRSICVHSDSWMYAHLDSKHVDRYAVFVSAPEGADIEPTYETGASIVEAVRKIIDALKGGTNKNGTKSDDQSEVAPF